MPNLPTLNPDTGIVRSEVERHRIVCFDLIRAIAIIMVMIDHFGGITPADSKISDTQFIVSKWLMAPDAVLFFMLSGALLLPVTGGWRHFYKKRLLRIVIPFIFWSAAYALIIGWYYNLSPDFILFRLRWFFLTPTFEAGWFLLALAGIYLFMPVISPWLERATSGQLLLVVALWLGAGLLPWLSYLMGVSHYESGIFALSFNYLGYAIAGYILARRLLPLRTLGIILLLVAAIAVPVVVYLHPGNIPVDQLLTNNLTTNVMAMAILIFAILLRMSSLPRWLKPVVAIFSRNAFGIYLIHFVFYYLMKHYKLPEETPVWVLVIAGTTCSLAANEILRRIPGIRRIV